MLAAIVFMGKTLHSSGLLVFMFFVHVFCVIELTIKANAMDYIKRYINKKGLQTFKKEKKKRFFDIDIQFPSVCPRNLQLSTCLKQKNTQIPKQKRKSVSLSISTGFVEVCNIKHGQKNTTMTAFHSDVSQQAS